MAIKRMISIGALSFVAVFATSSLADDWLDKASNSMRETEVSLHSLVGEADYEMSEYLNSEVKSIVLTKGKLAVFYDNGKYQLRFKYDKSYIKVDSKDGKIRDRIVDLKRDELVIVYDGQTVYEIIFADQLNTSGCYGRIGTRLSESLQGNDIDVSDPINLCGGRSGAVNLIEKIGERGVNYESEVVKDGMLTKRYRDWSPAENRFEVDFNTALGNRITEFRLSNNRSTRSLQRETLGWENFSDHWYVTKRTRELSNEQRTLTKFEYTLFEPNKEIDPMLFTLKSIEIPIGSRFLDQRQVRIGPVPSVYKTADGLSPVRPIVPRNLSFDTQTESLVLTIPSRYERYSSAEEVGDFLRTRADREMQIIDKACSLSAEQSQRLKATLALHDSSMTRATTELIDDFNNSPVLRTNAISTNIEIEQFKDRMNRLNAQIQQSYWGETLGTKILRSLLDERQKKLLHEHCASEFIARFADGVNLTNDQRDALNRFIRGLFSGEPDLVFMFNPGVYLSQIVYANRSITADILNQEKWEIVRETWDLSGNHDAFFRILKTTRFF